VPLTVSQTLTVLSVLPLAIRLPSGLNATLGTVSLCLLRLRNSRPFVASQTLTILGYRAGGPHGLKAGEWTDDTSMALALAASIAEVGWDLTDQTRRYVRWWRNGEYSVNGRCFDIGVTTRSALSRFEATGDPHSSGSRAESASGNGSIMRLAPVPIRFAHLFPDRVSELAVLAAESSLPTHASSQCLSACRYLALILTGLMHGIDRDEVLSPDWELLQRLRTDHQLDPAVDEVAAGRFQRRSPPEIVGSGYVVRSLEAALWAFHNAADFREAVLKAVNLGDDADTTGAVCGQLAGAYWGFEGIPPEWIDGLAKREELESAVRAITSLLPVRGDSDKMNAESGGQRPTKSRVNRFRS
jgi:ADP-ribosyl-[dinitrogen reductase] hydrolase